MQKNLVTDLPEQFEQYLSSFYIISYHEWRIYTFHTISFSFAILETDSVVVVIYNHKIYAKFCPYFRHTKHWMFFGSFTFITVSSQVSRITTKCSPRTSPPLSGLGIRPALSPTLWGIKFHPPPQKKIVPYSQLVLKLDIRNQRLTCWYLKVCKSSSSLALALAASGSTSLASALVWTRASASWGSDDELCCRSSRRFAS